MKDLFGRRTAFLAGIIFGLLILFFMEKAWAAKNGPRWSVFAYGGKWTESSISEILQAKTRFRDSYVGALGVSRTIHKVNNYLGLEIELNAARHTGLQHHHELNVALNLRWHQFPWNRYVKTSLSYGLGPSYAFRRPPLEYRDPHDPTPARLLVFMPVEITFGLPEKYQLPWEFLLRVHHRSGAYGLVSHARGSNFIVSGLRYRF